MLLEKVSLFGFKNYEEASLLFTQKVNCIIGENGSGKSNLLDAIYYLALTKSAWNPVDAQNIKGDSPFFTIKGTFLHRDKYYEVQCGLQRGQKKIFKVDSSEYEKLREHIGRFPLVIIMPDDVDIIRGGSENRRKFFDGIIAQSRPNYLESLLRYRHYLKQRNSLLKQFAERGKTDHDLLEPYTYEVLRFGKIIYEERKSFLESFKSSFEQHYNFLSDDRESTDIRYKSDLDKEDYEELFREHLAKDLAYQRTALGVHRDDFPFFIHNHKPLKKYGSQGQQKSYLVALKLAQFDMLKKEHGKDPLLLLDDIFDKLDDTRISKLMSMVASEHFGQLFLTDARGQRAKEILNGLNIDAKFFIVEKGVVQEEK